MAKKGGKKAKVSGEIKSKKKLGKHPLDQLQFTSRANEKVYDKLAMEYVQNHLPKIMDIVPKEVRENRGDKEFKTPGKLYDENLRTIDTKDTYVKRAKTFIKWHVIHKGISSLGEITEDSTRDFFKIMADNIGTAKNEYSTKTYDSYVDGVYKYFEAVTRDPKDAVTKLDGREYANPISSAKTLHNQEFRDDIRGQVKNYSQDDYKRGKGYTIREANIIMKAAEKHMDEEKQLLVATLVYGATRNDETQEMRFDCYNRDEKRLELLYKGMCKQDRARMTLNVSDKLFEKVDQYEKKYKPLAKDEIFDKYNEAMVREVVKECCRLGKIAYSGVHDLRKSYLERTEKELFKQVRRGVLDKEILTNWVLLQVSCDKRLNPLVAKKEWVARTTKSGEIKYYQRNVKDFSGNVVMEQKFSYSKLMEKPIEELIDLYIAEQLGHNKTDTNNEYRSKEAKERRKEFIRFVKEERKKKTGL